jgi:hypothetical protein
VQPGGDVSAVPGTVTETVYLGSATHYQVDIGGGEAVTVFLQNSSDSTLAADRGDRRGPGIVVGIRALEARVLYMLDPVRREIWKERLDIWHGDVDIAVNQRGLYDRGISSVLLSLHRRSPLVGHSGRSSRPDLLATTGWRSPF